MDAGIGDVAVCVVLWAVRWPRCPQGYMESAVHSPLTPVYPLSETELNAIPYPILQVGPTSHWGIAWGASQMLG